MVAPLIAAAGISAASSIGGSLLSHFMGESSKRQEYERQKEFAQNGVRWRVADAKAAGIHPLAALGNYTSYSPQSAVGTDFGLSQAGQNIGRAIESKASQEERQELDDLQKDVFRAQAENIRADTSLKREQTAHAALTSLNSQTQLPPPMPRSRGVSAMSGISADYKPSGGDKAITLASLRSPHVSLDKAYEAYEIPFLGSQLPLATDEASNMMEGVFGEVQWQMRRLEDAVSKGDDTYYDFTTGTYRRNSLLHDIQQFILEAFTPQGYIENVNDLVKRFTEGGHNAPLTAYEKQVIRQSLPQKGIFGK